MSKSIIPRINSGSGSGSGGSSGSESSSGSGSTSSGGTASGGGQNSQGGNTSSAQTQSSRTVAEKKEATKVVATTGADPIDLFSGAHRIEFPVMSQSGALNIGVSLSYRSDKSVEGVFGKGFSWNYESFVEENEGEIQLYYSPADYVLFSKSSTRDCYTTDAVGSETDELYKNADGSITLECNGKQFDYGINRKLNKVTEKTGESVLIEYKDKEIDLVDGVSGQRIVLLMNERGYVERVSNGASSQALFEYDEKGWLTKYTDSDGFVTSYTYDEEGRVLTGIDGDGNVYFEDIYNEAGKVSKQRDAYGNESTFEYIDKDDNKQETIFTNRLGDTRKYEFDEDGRILLETDEAGNKEESRYDEYGNCVEKIDPLAASIKMEYDNRHNLTKITDEVGNITCYEYDDNDNLVKICYADGSNESYCYDKYNRLESSIDLRGLETVYEYNSDGLLIRSEAGEKVTTYTYENGRVKTISDTIGNTTSFSYDENGHLAESVDACGAVTKSTVSPYGTVLDTTDALGNKTATTYSCVNKPLVITDANGNVITNKYDARQLLTETTDARGNTTRYYYDAEERLIKTVFADESFTETEYDAVGKIKSVTDAEGKKSFYEYDAAGNIIKETDKNGNSESFSYDAAGNLISKTDKRGNVTTYTYDVRGRVATETNPLGGVTAYAYNEAGDVITIADPLSNIISYDRDIYGNVRKETDPNGNATYYGYSLNNNVVRTTNALGQSTINKFDSTGRLISSGNNDTYEEGFVELRNIQKSDVNAEKSIVASEGIVHIHEGTDKGTSVSGCHKEAYSSYEVVGYHDETRSSYATQAACDNCGIEMHYCRCPGGPTSCHTELVLVDEYTVSVPDYGNITRYTCNHENEILGRIDVCLSGNKLSAKTICTDGTDYPVKSYIWKLDDNEISDSDYCRLKDGGTYTLSACINDIYSGSEQTITLSYEYEKNSTDSGEITDVLNNSQGEPAVIRYEYDLKGQVVAVTDPNGNRTTKEYDAQGNVVKITDALGYEVSYEYDANSNLVSSTNAKNQTSLYSINRLNQVSSYTDALGLTTSYSYDKNGRMNKSINPMGKTSTSIFDGNGNTLAVTGPEGATTTFEYDANGNVTAKSTIGEDYARYTYNATDLAESITNGREQTIFCEYDHCGRIVKAVYPEGETTYTYDSNGNVISVTDGNGTVIRRYDALNRVISVTDTKGNVVGYEYDRYGNLKTIIYPDETCVSYTYDLCGNILSVTDFEGKVTEYSYDQLNREISEINGNGIHTEKTYDEIGNLIRKTETVISDSSVLSDTVYEYDAINRLIVETDSVSRQSFEHAYDELNRVTSRVTRDVESGAILEKEDFSLDGAGNITSVNENDSTKVFSYNKADNRIETAEGNSFVFDNDGNLVSGVIDGADAIFTYDSKSRLTAYNGSSYVYDSEDYRIQGTEKKKYSEFDEPDSEETMANVFHSKNLFDEKSINCDLKYVDCDTYFASDPVDIDDSDNCLVIEYYVNRTVTFDYLDMEITLDKSFLTEGKHYVLSLWRNILFSDQYSMEPIYYLSKGVYNGASLNRNGTIDIQYDGDSENRLVLYISCAPISFSNMRSIEEIHVQLEQADTVSDNFELYKAETVGPTNMSNEEFFGGIPDSSIEDGNVSSSEEIEDAEPAVEDENGEGDTEGLSEEDNSSEEDSENNISEGETETELELEEPELLPEEIKTEPAISFDADSESEEESEEELETESGELLYEETITSYCYDRENKNLLVSVSSDGKLKKYVYGNGLIASYEIVTNEIESTTEYESYLYDIRGSVTRVIDEDGRVEAEYSYSTYGKRTVIQGEESSLWGYCGRDGVITDENGLLYMRARYYSPKLMRFINEDIVIGDISISNSLNRYAYVEGNPATLIDPFGLEAQKSGAKSVDGARVFDGALNVGKGATLDAMGITLLKIGVPSFACGPAGVVCGVIACVGGGICIIFGSADVSEGTVQIINGVSASDYAEVNYIRDNVFGGDQIRYDSAEMLVVSSGYLTAGFCYDIGMSSAAAEASETSYGKSSGKSGADNIADAAKLKEYYKQAEKYGTGSIKELENGRFRFYEELKPARTQGEMAGARHVREWDPYTGLKRDWYETLDYNGNIRQVRPDPNITGGVKVHYMFDAEGNYIGNWIPKK